MEQEKQVKIEEKPTNKPVKKAEDKLRRKFIERKLKAINEMEGEAKAQFAAQRLLNNK